MIPMVTEMIPKRIENEVEATMEPNEYLKKPYARLVLPEEDGSFRAEIVEFPGCIATGDTASEALAALEEVAFAWLQAALAKGQRIPEPMENSQFSGKFVLRLSRGLHRRAALVAEREGISLNQFIATAVATHIGVVETTAQVTEPRPIVNTLNFNLQSCGNFVIAYTGQSAGIARAPQVEQWQQLMGEAALLARTVGHG
jgi:predicted RNase H-like HicB family nuclease